MAEEDFDIVLFDGVCNLCNGAVQFIIRHDKEFHYRFCPLQSDSGKRLLHPLMDVRERMPDSLILIRKGVAYFESDAALKIAQKLDGGWRFAAIALVLPSFLRNGIYRCIARNRYRWFGRRDKCMIPSPKLKNRFLV